MPTHPDLTDTQLQEMRRKGLAKGAEIAKLLEGLLAGEDIRLEGIPLLGDPNPSWLEIERVRYYLKMLNEARRRIDEGTAGFCSVCENPIPVAELMELPWADVDGDCAGKPIIAR